MSVDAVTYRRAEFLTRTFGFVVNIGETITGKEFSNRILSVFDRDLTGVTASAALEVLPDATVVALAMSSWR